MPWPPDKKLEFILRLKIKRNDLLQAASHCAYFEFETVLKFYNLKAWLNSTLNTVLHFHMTILILARLFSFIDNVYLWKVLFVA